MIWYAVVPEIASGYSTVSVLEFTQFHWQFQWSCITYSTVKTVSSFIEQFDGSTQQIDKVLFDWVALLVEPRFVNEAVHKQALELLQSGGVDLDHASYPELYYVEAL